MTARLATKLTVYRALFSIVAASSAMSVGFYLLQTPESATSVFSLFLALSEPIPAPLQVLLGVDDHYHAQSFLMLALATFRVFQSKGAIVPPPEFGEFLFVLASIGVWGVVIMVATAICVVLPPPLNFAAALLSIPAYLMAFLCIPTSFVITEGRSLAKSVARHA